MPDFDTVQALAHRDAPESCLTDKSGQRRAIRNRRDDANLTFRGPTDRVFSGVAPYQEFLSSIVAAFPDLELQVDEVYWMGNDKDGYLTSERWSAMGTHSGAGIYGDPTNRPTQLWGITQHEIVDGRIVKEWMLFNELDLMMQLASNKS